jgi:hypothetical protein
MALVLNPSGGLTGSAWSSVPFMGRLGNHSVFHDAMGFLANAGGVGPGYLVTNHFNLDVLVLGQGILWGGATKALSGQLGGITMQAVRYGPTQVPLDTWRATLD